MKKVIKKVVKKKREDNAGIFVPAGLFIGLAFGFVYGQIPTGVLGGLGVGFLLMALFKIFKK